MRSRKRNGSKKKNAAGFYVTKRFRVLVTPRDENAAAFPGLADRSSVAYEPVDDWIFADDIASENGRVTSVSGLPAGLSVKYAYANAKKKTGKYLKQAGQTIVGTPTKAGTYVVTFTKNVKSGDIAFIFV